MNAYLVRTRLHCLIAMELQRTLFARQEYIAIFLYQKSREEDDPTVYATYELLRAGATESYDIVGQDGIVSNVAALTRALRKVSRAGGHAHLAVINSLPIALTLRLIGGPKLQTFDDGGINVNPASAYFSTEPLPGRGLRRWGSRLLFPQGHTKWMRDHSTRHYTILPGNENIVPADRVVPITLDWAKLLHEDDLPLLSGDIRTVVLGTPHEDFPDPDASRELARGLAEESDLYLRHPREGGWLENPIARNLRSPAEAVLLYLASRRPLRVYHFNSTTGYVLAKHPRMDVINLVDPESRTLQAELVGIRAAA